MTCGSFKSGMASSGKRRNAATPHPSATSAARSTAARWRADHSMRRPITCLGFLEHALHAALRVDEEACARDHLLAFADAGEKLHRFTRAQPNGDGARLEAAV